MPEKIPMRTNGGGSFWRTVVLEPTHVAFEIKRTRNPFLYLTEWWRRRP